VSKLLTKTPYVSIFLAVIVKATVNYGSNPSGTLATTIPIKKIIDYKRLYPFNKAVMKKTVPNTAIT